MLDGLRVIGFDGFTDEYGRRWRVVGWKPLTDEYEVVRAYRFQWPWRKPEIKVVRGEYIDWCAGA